MRWRQGRRSQNVEDLRVRGSGRGPGRGKLAAGGGVGVLVVALAALFFDVDLSALLQGVPGGGGGAGGLGGAREAPAVELTPQEEELGEFVRVILGYTEDVWNELFRQSGQRYQEPTLVLFRDAANSACGRADSSVGPFYCPADRRVYIDLTFFKDLKQRFGAPGDFAQAYVIAHEIGHHVQNLLGTSAKVHAQRGRVSQAEFNKLSVRLELQADFYAGVWARHAHEAARILERGDLEEALRAATAIGDDRLQKQARGYVTPDSFTHGTSAQRVRWFRKGWESGDPAAGDTFSATKL